MPYKHGHLTVTHKNKVREYAFISRQGGFILLVILEIDELKLPERYDFYRNDLMGSKFVMPGFDKVPQRDLNTARALCALLKLQDSFNMIREMAAASLKSTQQNSD
jgi:hypothetical protein